MAAIAAQPDLILTLDITGIIQRAQVAGSLTDDEAANLVDQTVPAWVGRVWKDTCDTSNAGKVERILKGAINDEVCGYSQINQQLPSGQTRVFEFVAVQTHTEQQRIVVIGKNLSAV